MAWHADLMLSLLLYLYLSKAYQYRVRDWVVNVQWMVEDIIEWRIKQEEQYWRDKMVEQQVVINSFCSDNDTVCSTRPKDQ